jgi:hypothetical protein
MSPFSERVLRLLSRAGLARSRPPRLPSSSVRPLELSRDQNGATRSGAQICRPGLTESRPPLVLSPGSFVRFAASLSESGLTREAPRHSECSSTDPKSKEHEND